MNHSWNPFLRYPRAALVLSCLLCVPFFVRLPQFRLSSETRTLLEGDQRNLESYEKVKQILANVDVVVVSMECAEVFSPKGIDAVRRVSNALQDLDGVEDVKSLTHSVKPVRRGLTFEMVPLVPTGAFTAQELEAFKSFCLEHPLIRDVMVAADGKHTILTVTCRRQLDTPESQRRFRGEIESALAPFQAEGLKFRTLALPLIEEEIRSTLESDIGTFLPVSILILVGILGWTFRSWRILLLVLANQAFVLLVLPGAMAMTGLSLSVFTVMLFPLLSGIHLAQLAHVYSGFQTAQRSGLSTDEALQSMLGHVFKSCVFSLVTTGIGLLSLATSEVQQIREFGYLGAFGVCLVFCLTFGPGLALMKLVLQRWPLRNPNSALPTPHSAPASAAWIEAATRMVERRGTLMIALFGGTVLVAGLGIAMVRTDIRAVEFLHRNSQTRQAVEEFDRVYGGINVVQIEINSGGDNRINDLAFLKYVERLQQFAQSQTDVSASYSYAQLIAMINQIWEGGSTAGFKLPENSLLINLFVLALKAQNFPFLTALCDPSFRTAYLVVRTRDMPSDRYLEIIRAISDFAERNRPDGITVSAAAGIHSILEADRRILRSQTNSAGGSSAVIGLVLTLLWRSPKLALLSLITNAVPVALVIAIAGFASVPLNSITIMVAAICLGIAVDDSIHFITHWRDDYRAGFSAREAVANAYRVKGRPIVFTSLILIAIYSVFWFSSFPPVIQFGWLSGAAFAGALVTVLFFLPAVLCRFRKH